MYSMQISCDIQWFVHDALLTVNINDLFICGSSALLLEALWFKKAFPEVL